MANNTIKEQTIFVQPASITVLQNCGGSIPIKLFQGYDSVSGRGLSAATIGATTSTDGTGTTDISVCLDIATLAQALQINQSLSTSFGAITSFDEKMQFLQSLNLTTYSTAIVIYASHIAGIETTTNVALANGIIPPTDKTELNAFFQAYGDSYLSSVTRGGEYYAVYTFYTQTLEEQSALTSEINANGIYGGMTMDINVQKNLTRLINSTSIRCSFRQNISGIRNPQLPDVNNLISFALSFVSTPLTAPALIAFEATGYEHVPKIVDFEPIPSNRNYFVGKGATDGLAKRLVQIQQLLNQINWLQETYNFYGGFTDTKVQQVKTQANADLAAINNQIQQYEFDPTQNFTMPALTSLTYGTPSLCYQVGSSLAYGGSGGHPFNDTNVMTAIQKHQRITTVQLRSGNYIDNLTVTYQINNTIVQRTHGSNGGTLGPFLTLLPGQFITGISGRSDTYINNLQLQISDGRTVGGGGSDGTPYAWKVPSGYFVLGFSGRSGSYLDQVQISYAGFQPATWQ